jgi:glycosyltransferase involved in cell wall biosynthesis
MPDLELMAVSPLVSVVLPVFNGATYIVAAVNSILAQTFTDFELLVIDDGSTDATRDLLAPIARTDQRLQILAEPHRGLVGTLNHGLAVARGALIARMDADDVALPGRLAAQVAYLKSHPDCVVVGTTILKVKADGHSKSPPKWKLPIYRPLAFPPEIGGVPHPTALMRADALATVGGYRAYFYNAEDRDLWARLWTVGRIHQLPDVALHYRVHAGSVTRLRRGEQLLSHMLADMSAVARTLQRDDHDILTRSVTHGKQAALDEYSALIGDAYPVDTYRMYHCIRNRMWSFAPFKSRHDMLNRVAQHVWQRPLAPDRLKLLATMVRHGPAAQRLGSSDS